ncbi:potassium channel family protein [Idiomarina piscisalsi]|uniref:Ion transporter n=1 Tax=Idiomarina piscisalsi TaxID=1096243 RepID=A0A432YHI7_9GAMM|nr:potassium channel family protein [Idiomarina piscisalsi]RUO60404.1 ion transporter [Idiomarina piscisalsi]
MLLSFICNALIVGLAVVFHYEALNRIGWLISHLHMFSQIRLMFGVVLAIIAHTAEVAIFAVGYYAMHHHANFGYLTGNFDGSFLDALYFSFTVFTTVGFGDIEPVGMLRFLTGVEGLTGLVLITWTASFLYVEMQRYWRR